MAESVNTDKPVPESVQTFFLMLMLIVMLHPGLPSSVSVADPC